MVLDLGYQPAADHFPRPEDPEPDPVYSLRMLSCAACGLAQLESDPTTAEEPRGVEPRALREQAHDAIDRCFAAGQLKSGDRVIEFTSPHGGSWIPALQSLGVEPAVGGQADVVLDSFGMMHSSDQRAAMGERVERLAPGGVLLLQFHSLAAILKNVTWSALRHGHFAYYSAPVLVDMAAEFGLLPVGAWQFSLYGGSVLMAFREAGSPSRDAVELISRELAIGVRDTEALGRLQTDMAASVRQLTAYLDQLRRRGLRVAGYGAASRAVSILQLALPSKAAMLCIADASAAKQGRALPGVRVPIVSPRELAQAPPDRVVLFVGDLLDEVRLMLPEIEDAGGRWVTLEPEVREIPALIAGIAPSTTSGLADRNEAGG